MFVHHIPPVITGSEACLEKGNTPELEVEQHPSIRTSISQICFNLQMVSDDWRLIFVRKARRTKIHSEELKVHLRAQGDKCACVY